MDRHVAVYRWMLRVYPAKFRLAYGEEMTQLFAHMLADHRQSGHSLGIFRLWVHTIFDTLANASREQKEETMHNHVALTRTLLVVVAIAVYLAFALAGSYMALLVLFVGIAILAARRRSLPDALLRPRRGHWWVWSLAGLATSGSGFLITNLPVPGPGELRWLLFTLLFFAGVLIVAASIVQALVWISRRPSTPSAE